MNGIMVVSVLCVAEKPSIAKAVANHLGGGQVQTVSHSECISHKSRMLMYDSDPLLAMSTPRTMSFNTPSLVGGLVM